MSSPRAKVNFIPDKVQPTEQKTTRVNFIPDKAPKNKGGLLGTPEDLAEDVKQFAGTVLEGFGGAYGNIADFLRLQPKENMLPGQKLRYEMEANASPSDFINLAGSDDVMPEYSRLPSSSNIREMTGRPEPTTSQGRFSSRAGGAFGSTLAFPATPAAIGANIAGSAAGQTVRELGGPEWAATGTDIGTSLVTGAIPGISKSGQVATKPSGLPIRKFEKITKPTKVSEAVKEKITGDVGEDLRQSAYKIMEGNKTFSGMKEMPDFNRKLNSAFDKVEEEAAKIKEPIKIYEIKNEFQKIIREKTRDRFMPSEQQKAYRHYAKQFLKDFPEGEISAIRGVKSFRQNNADLSKAKNITRSTAQNLAKEEAIRDKNIALERVFENKFSDKPFTPLFKLTNAIHSDMKNIEKIEGFLDKVTEKGIDFKAAQKYYSDYGLQKSISKTFGKEAEEQFSSLVGDFLSKKESMRLLKVAKSSGIDIADVMKYIASPEWAVGSVGIKQMKNLYQRSLANPKKLYDWREGIKYIKDGQFQKGAEILRTLDEKES